MIDVRIIFGLSIIFLLLICLMLVRIFNPKKDIYKQAAEMNEKKQEQKVKRK